MFLLEFPANEPQKRAIQDGDCCPRCRVGVVQTFQRADVGEYQQDAGDPQTADSGNRGDHGTGGIPQSPQTSCNGFHDADGKIQREQAVDFDHAVPDDFRVRGKDLQKRLAEPGEQQSASPGDHRPGGNADLDPFADPVDFPAP